MQAGKFKKIIAFLGLISLVLFGAIYFVYDQIRSKSEKIAVVEHDLSQKNNRYDYLISMEKLVSDIEPDLKKINESVVSKTGNVAFIEGLEGLAKNYDLTIKIDSLTLVTNPKAASSTPATLVVKAKTGGTWANSYLFLSEIEAMSFNVKINKFGFDAGEDIPKDGSKSAMISPWNTSFEISVLKYQ